MHRVLDMVTSLCFYLLELCLHILKGAFSPIVESRCGGRITIVARLLGRRRAEQDLSTFIVS